ncbi:S41 family peptidase [Micavibrio aeruginosavorus]|uniref:Carboxyl-terminal protease n=1 Tax=Micavibrio aeruginosavorus EPB TaxID=349215 RepID=M4VCH7_9BACT|nr:S41 family peptidase [Micavibrio aeruginosavorus]AGH97082.1 Carboxyl-terminal protease [Micavibrio aeruginosavorus EPB]
MTSTAKKLCALFLASSCVLGTGCVSVETTEPVSNAQNTAPAEPVPTRYFKYDLMNRLLDDVARESFANPQIDDMIRGAIDHVREMRGPDFANSSDAQIKAMIDGEGIFKDEHEKIIVDAITGALSRVSPHDYYVTPEEVRESIIGKSTLKGIGIIYQNDNRIGGLVIEDTADDGPAKAAGIKRGDIITKVENTSVAGKFYEAAEMILGEVGTPVTLSIIPRGETEEKTMTLKRSVVTFSSVRYNVIDNDIGYIRLRNFSDLSSFNTINDAIREMKQAHNGTPLRGFVLDLRNNPGGRVTLAARLANNFIDSETGVSVTVENKKFSYDEKITRGDILNGAPLAVLVNDATASAAEILSGALQDHKRATIVGTQSYGKGSVQSPIYLSRFDKNRDDAIRITTALYRLPSGAFLQGYGIMPDILVDGVEARLKEHERDKDRMIKNPDADKIASRKASQTCRVRDDFNTQVANDDLRLFTGEPDKTLLCAIDHLRRNSQYTITRPNTPAPDKLRAPNP